MLVRLTTLVDRVEGLRLRVMAAAMDVADVEGAPTVAAWLAPRTRATTRSLHGREQLARGMDRRWQAVGAGVAAGTVSLAQAEVIVRALEALDAPAVGERVDRELLAMAERHLVEKAAEFTPPALRALGERILEVICPERYDDPNAPRCWPPNAGPPPPPGSPCTCAATAPSTCAPGSPKPPRHGCRPTWRPSPHPAATTTRHVRGR